MSCQKCDKTFDSGWDFNKHSHNGSKEEPKVEKYFCDQCGRDFESSAGWRHHYRHKHKSLPPELLKEDMTTPEGSFMCELCSKIFISEFLLKHHIRVSHSKKQELVQKKKKCDGAVRNCPHCDKTFSRSKR